MREILNLNGQWALYSVSHSDVRRRHLSPTAEEELRASGFVPIPASVPGNFELDLSAAGLLPKDLFFGENPLLCQKEENKHLWYVRRFSLPALPEGEVRLRLEGVDTFGEIYLNGDLLGTCDNMLIEHEFSATSLRAGENELLVHILPTAIVARSFEGDAVNRALSYNFDSIHVRKAPYMFGWDIMPRAVSGGLWRTVSLVEYPENRLADFYIATRNIDLQKREARLQFCFRLETQEDFLDDFEVVIRGACGASVFEKRVFPFGANCVDTVTVKEPLLWSPRGVGEPNLYEVEALLYRGGTLCDKRRVRLGIRTVRLERTSVVREGKGRFDCLVNGEKIFIMGTNWVPLHPFPSQDKTRLADALALVEDVGCNMIRLWGGNHYESDEFYDFCDEHGILLWQDFAMGCAVYPQNDDFCAALRKEAISVVKRLRNHPSLFLWAGDNECDFSYLLSRKNNGSHSDPNRNILTRQVLPRVLDTYDPFRPYLPSSPYMDIEAVETGLPLSEDHLWGPSDFFKSDYYTKAVCRFASETGFHGCPSPASLRRFIGEDHLWRGGNVAEDGRPDRQWLVHAASMDTEHIGPYEYRIGLMNAQVVELFGKMPQSLSDFALASQIFQAEGFKYMIERFRIRKETHGGIIWWNLLDGWPQISDAVVDFYFTKKLAYSYIKTSQQPLCMMMDEPRDGSLSLFAANETPSQKRLTYTVTRLSDGALLCNGDCAVDAFGLTRADSVPWSATERECYLLEWTDGEGQSGKNHYISNVKGISLEEYQTLLNRLYPEALEDF